MSSHTRYYLDTVSIITFEHLYDRSMSHDGVAFINVSLASFDTNTILMKDGFYYHDINIVFRHDAIIYLGCQVL